MIPDAMIRTLKGPALAILLLLMNHPHEILSAEFIERNSGYGDEAVQRGLLLLRDYRLVNRINRYNWQLAGDQQQLPLGEYQLEAEIDSGKTGVPQGQSTDFEPGTEAESVEDLPKSAIDSGKTGVPLRKMAGTPEKPESRDSSSSRSLNLINQEKQDLLLARNDGSPKTRANFTALTENGVREPARSRLAGLGHVTVELIAHHCETAQTIGQAIYRIEHGWPVKDEDFDDDRSKYAGGKYADWINH